MDQKRKIIRLVFLLAIISTVTFLGFKIVNRKETLQKAEQNTRTLSAISNALEISLSEFIKPTLLIYMNSECEHCQWQVKELVKIEEELMDVQVILVSIEPVDSLNDFLSGIPFQSSLLFKTYEIEPEKVRTAFGRPGTPQVFIYRNNQLVKFFKGEVRVDLLTEALDQSINVTEKAK